MKTNQRVNTDLNFKRALNRSFLLHVALIIVIIARVAFPSSSRPMSMTVSAEDNPTPIQASMVDLRELEAEAKRKEKAKADALAAQEAEKQKIINEQKRIQAEKEKVELARKAEEKRVADIQLKKKAAEQAALDAQKKKAAAEAAQKTAAEKAMKQAEAAAKAAKAKKDAELAKALAAERMPATESGALSGEAMRELDRYKLLVQQQIMRHWFVQGAPAAGLSTLLFVRVAPNGSVLDVKIKRPSGNDALDRSAMAAVLKASPLPVPQDPALSAHFRELNLTLRPDDVVQGG